MNVEHKKLSVWLIIKTAWWLCSGTLQVWWQLWTRPRWTSKDFLTSKPIFTRTVGGWWYYDLAMTVWSRWPGHGWKEMDCLKKLLAFLIGHVAAHFYALTDTTKETYDNLVRNLKSSLCRAVKQEKIFAQFEQRTLPPGEDLFVFL